MAKKATNYHTSTGYHSALGVYKQPASGGLMGKQGGQLVPKGPAKFGPPAVGGPSPAGPQAAPANPVADAQFAAAERNYQTGTAGLDLQAQQAFQAYVDPGNPISKMRLLMKSYQDNQNRNTNGVNNIYGGHYQNVQNYATGNYLNADQANTQTYQNLMNQIALRRRQLADTKTSTEELARATPPGA